MKRLICLLKIVAFIVLLYGIACSAAEAADQDAIVNEVKSITLIESTEIPAYIFRAVEQQISSVMDSLLRGKYVSDVSGIKKRPNEIVAEIENRIPGFTVEKLTILSGTLTETVVTLKPAGSLASGIEYKLDHTLIFPGSEAMLYADLQSVKEFLNLKVKGIPLASVENYRGLIEGELTVSLLAVFKGFIVKSRVTGSQTDNLHVRVELSSSPAQIAAARVNIVSDSMPRTLLSRFKGRVESIVSRLTGLPLVFAESHKSEICRNLAGLVDAVFEEFPFGLKSEITLDVAGLADVNISLESENARLESFLGIPAGMEPKNPYPTLSLSYTRIIVGNIEAGARLAVPLSKPGMTRMDGNIAWVPYAELKIGYRAYLGGAHSAWTSYGFDKRTWAVLEYDTGSGLTLGLWHLSQDGFKMGIYSDGNKIFWLQIELAL